MIRMKSPLATGPWPSLCARAIDDRLNAIRPAGAGRSLRAVAAALLFAAAGWVACPAIAAAQTPAPMPTMTIRLVDAKTGKPMHDKIVSVAFYVEDGSMTNGRRRVAYPNGQFWTNLPVDKDGLGSIQVPQGATIVEVGKGLDNDGTKITEKGIQLFMCQGAPEFTRADSGFQYGRVGDVLATGLIAKDPDCQPRLKIPVAPGQFVVMAWPPSWNPLAGGIAW
jgi:hypothetical protein